MKTLLKAASVAAVALTIAQPAFAQTPAAPVAAPANNGITVPGIGIANIDLIVVNSNAFKTAQTQRPVTYKATYDAAEARRKAITDQITPMITRFNADRAAPNANQQALAQQAQAIQAMEASGTQELQRLLQPVSYSEAYVQEQISEINADIFNTVSEKLNEVLSNTVSGLGSVVGLLTNAFVGIVTMPIILYYLLKEGDKLPLTFLQIFPTNLRESIGDLLKKVNTQISQYVRGQITVAFFVGLMFVIGYAIIGMKFGIVLGIFAGFLNIIPYMGSFIAMVPAVIVAIVDSPLMLAKVLLVFSIEQFIEGRVISPQILGSNLEVHPVTIIFVLLTAGKLFGLTGFILGIPGYAVLKVLFMHIFEWYKEISGLYLDEPEIEEEPEEDYLQE